MRIAQPAPWASPGGQPPAPPQPPRKHGGGRPKTSPEATQTILRMLSDGASVRSTAEAAGVSWPTARAIWIRERGTWPPPGLGKGSGHGGGSPPRALSRGKTIYAARRIEDGETVAAVTEDLNVAPQTLYRAIERLKRPAIGEPVNVRFGTDLLAMVDDYAAKRDISRAEAIRQLVQDAVTRARVNEA